MSKTNQTKTLKVGLCRKLFVLIVTLSYIIAGVDGSGVAIVFTMALSLTWIIFELWLILQGIIAVQNLLIIIYQKALPNTSVEDKDTGKVPYIEGEKE